MTDKEDIAYRVRVADGKKIANWEAGDPTEFYFVPSRFDYGYDFDVVVTQETQVYIEKRYHCDVCMMGRYEFESGFADEVIALPFGMDIDRLSEFGATLSIVPFSSLNVVRHSA